MSNIDIDQKTRKVFSEFGKRGGAKTKATQSPDHYSKIGKKSWKERLKREGKDALRKRMSEVRRAGIEKAKKRKLEEERKQTGRKVIKHIGGTITKFLQNGE